MQKIVERRVDVPVEVKVRQEVQVCKYEIRYWMEISQVPAARSEQGLKRSECYGRGWMNFAGAFLLLLLLFLTLFATSYLLRAEDCRAPGALHRGQGTVSPRF